MGLNRNSSQMEDKENNKKDMNVSKQVPHSAQAGPS